MQISKKSRVFIGSSTEAIERNLVSFFVEELKGRCEPFDWSQTFKLNDITIESIIEQANQYDFAIFLFCNDDEGQSRQKNVYFARDNVVFEAGIFIGILGRERVHIVLEDGVKNPSDLFGITLPTLSYSNENDSIAKNSIRIIVSQIADQIDQLGSREIKFPEWNSFSKHEFPCGLQDAIKLDYLRVTERFFLSKSIKNSSTKPLDFYSNRTCIEAYVGGLENVNERYWTTTSLKSAFWTNANDFLVTAANSKMIERLKIEHGEAKRLFLLDNSLDVHLQLLNDEISYHRKHGYIVRVKEKQKDFRKLKRKIEDQINSGFLVKAFYDKDYYEDLPSGLKFNPNNAELAIYDSKRIDIFQTGSLGELIAVDSYTDRTINFSVILDQIKSYFEDCWNKAEDITNILERIDEEIEHAIKKIDYRRSWLSYYEQDFNENDAKLKSHEIESVLNKLKQTGAWGNINNYLDIGTCTGRYLFGMRECLSKNGKMLGLDDDFDCIEFIHSKLEKAGSDLSDKVRIERANFVSRELPECLQGKKFDLITCMLGTFSHFCEKYSNNDDAINIAVDRMVYLLEESGHLFISNWSKPAADDKKFLSIYSDEDKRKLAEWTPPLRKLVKIFESRGLYCDISHIDSRLDFYHLRKSMKSNSIDISK